MTAKVDPVETAKHWSELTPAESAKPVRVPLCELVASSRVVLAAAEVCSHEGVERVILDATLADDIKALKAALEGRE